MEKGKAQVVHRLLSRLGVAGVSELLGLAPEDVDRIAAVGDDKDPAHTGINAHSHRLMRFTVASPAGRQGQVPGATAHHIIDALRAGRSAPGAHRILQDHVCGRIYTHSPCAASLPQAGLPVPRDILRHRSMIPLRSS